MAETEDHSADSQTPVKKPDLPNRVARFLHEWSKVIYAGTALVIAGIAFWAVVRPLLPHRHLEITATCKLSSGPTTPGTVRTLTYVIGSNVAANVGLGAGLYDNKGVDRSDGSGDVDSYPLKAGRNVTSRPIDIPAHLPAGRYEVDGEIWPPNQIGANGANTYAGPTCAWLTVP